MKKTMFLMLLSASLLSGLFYSCSNDRNVSQETQESSSLESYVAVDNEILQGSILPVDTNFVFKKCDIVDNVYMEVYEANEHATPYEEISGTETTREIFKAMVFMKYHTEDRLNSLAENKTTVGYRLIWPDGNQLDYVFPFDEVKKIASSEELVVKATNDN